MLAEVNRTCLLAASRIYQSIPTVIRIEVQIYPLQFHSDVHLRFNLMATHDCEEATYWPARKLILMSKSSFCHGNLLIQRGPMYNSRYLFCCKIVTYFLLKTNEVESSSRDGINSVNLKSKF